MRLKKDMHYQIRLHRKRGGSRWIIVCLDCMKAFRRVLGKRLEIVAYVQKDCEKCKREYRAPKGLRPGFKMRTVVYRIVASYPEYDQTI